MAAATEAMTIATKIDVNFMVKKESVVFV